jgi:hypothetical protein
LATVAATPVIALVLVLWQPYAASKETIASLQLLCDKAGESYFEVPSEVEGVYLDPSVSGDSFSGIVDGKYRYRSFGVIGEPLLNAGDLLFYEEPNQRPSGMGSDPYVRHEAPGPRATPVPDLASEYGIFQTREKGPTAELTADMVKTQVNVKHLGTGKIMASLTFVMSDRDRTVCGHSGKDHLGVQAFVRKALNLSRRFPSELPGGTSRSE